MGVLRKKIQSASASIAGAATKAASKAAEQGGMNTLMKTVQKGGFTGRQKYRLTKNILNKGFKQQATRAATVLGVSKNMAQAKADVAKYNYMAQAAALDRYNQIINQNPQPADGTGNPESPNSDTEEVTPIGNH